MWWLIFLAIGVAMMSGHAFFGWWWLFLLIPLAFSARHSRYGHRGYGWCGAPRWNDADFEKPKHRASDFDSTEKPKRGDASTQPARYIRRDDGELLEVIEEKPSRPRPSDKTNGGYTSGDYSGDDDVDYV